MAVGLTSQNYFQGGNIGLNQSMAGLSPDAQAAITNQERRRQLANILLKQGLEPHAPYAQAGRFVVPMNWAQGLAQMAQAGLGAYGNYSADKQEQQTLAEEQAKNQSANSLMADALRDRSKAAAPAVPASTVDQGSPAQTVMGQGLNRGYTVPAVPPSYGPESPGQPDQPAVTDTSADKYGRMREAMLSLSPFQQRMQAPMMEQARGDMMHEDDQAFRVQQAREAQASRSDIAKQQLTQAMMLGLISKDQKDQMLAQQAGHYATQDTFQRDQMAQNNELKKAQMAQQSSTEQDRLDAKAQLAQDKVDVKKEGVLNQDTSMLQSSNAAFDRLGASANVLLNHPGLVGITGLRGRIPNIPGSDAANADALLNTLKSQVGFGVMQELKNNSKTGSSGLGALSDAEGKRLENNLAALDKAQSEAQMRHELKAIAGYSEDAKSRLRDAFNLKHKGMAYPSASEKPTAGTATIASDADYDALPSGSTFISPDGKTRKKP